MSPPSHRTQISRSAQVLVVNPSLNVDTLKEFIALAQANPGELNYGSVVTPLTYKNRTQKEVEEHIAVRKTGMC